ncbi:melanoma inhibitory activity protein 2 isoform X3 [Paroedura picta]|uniref:melanoma inhibitory activity protein 2 isoform X3 n=1 Tax=Paroedura picta TaxID=143630 RepID=UPI0040574A0E
MARKLKGKMWKTVRILLLLLLLLTNVKTTELSDQKKCGDPECETTISRVQTIKDYTGPDCRYLNFKSGEEIMVYFKLSRKREDLWAGSKGKDFGYFPMDAVQTEEVFITEEVEVPTKETDFLCLDGGEYVFENKDSIFNTENEEYEHVPFHTDEDYSKSNMPRDEAMEVTGTSFPKEYKEPDSDDGKSEDQHTPEIIWAGDSELRGSKTGVDENIREEDHRSHSLQPDPKQATWSASGIASWLGLGGKQEEEPVREISKTSETITFRRRKIAIIDDSDFKKLNDDSETEPRTWFQSALTDFMHFGNKKAGFSLLHKENDPDVQDISRITGDADHYGSTTASDTQEKKSRDSTVSKSNWFDLDISDVLTFGYLNENKVQREKYGETETASPNEETGILMDQSLEEQISESPPHHEVQEKYIQEITEVKKPDSKVQLTNDHTEFKEAMDTSVSTEPGDKLLKSHYAEHSSVSDSEITENLNIKAIMKESGRKNDQSGWYESIYSNIFGFSRVKSDNWPAHNSVSIQRSQELAIPSHGEDQNFLQKDSSTAREENSGSPQTHQSFFSSSPFTNTLNAEGFASKEKGNVQITEQALLSREGSSQSKKENKIFHIKKESKVQLVGNQKVTEKVSVILDVATFQEATKYHKENREKTQDVELEKDISTLKFVKFRSEQGICYDHDIQITTYGKPENSEIQNYSSIQDKNYCPILEDKQWSFLDDSLTQWKSTRENINAHEKFAPVIKEPDDGVAVRLKYSEIDFSHLSAAQIYLQRLPKGEMTETTTDKEGSNQATDRKLTFEELKELPEHFPQTKDNLHEDGVLHDVSDDDKLDIQQSREQMLSENLVVIENIEVKEIARHSDGIKSQKKINHPPQNDITNVNANLFHNQNEEGEVISQDIQNSAQFPPFSRASEDKKHVNDKLQEGYVVDSYDENESPDLKSKGKLNHTKDYFPTNSDYNVKLTRSEIPHESINQPCQERIKERGQPSQHVSELSESKHGDSIQDTEDELKKQTNKNNPDVLNNQEPSPVATSKEVFKGEKDIPGNGACMSKDDFISYRVHNKDIQIPHKWAAGKSGEAEHSSKSIQENVVNAVSDASSTTKAGDDHGLKAQVILSYPSSGTFSSQTPVSLPYLKEDKKTLKAEQEVLSSHPEPSDCEKEIVVKNIEGSNGNTGKEGTTNTGKLSCGAATVHLDKKPNSGQHLKTNKIPSVNTEYKMCTSKSSGQLNLKERGLVQNPVPQNCTFRYEREWPFQIILYLNDICDLVKSAFSFVMFMREKVVAALPDNVRPGPNLYGFPWEMVICCTVVALLIAFLLMYRSYQSVRSRLYVGREKQLANKVAELVEDKCKVLEQLSLCKKEYEELENSLKDTTLLSASTSASNCKTACEQLSSSNSVLKKEIECLEKELEEEKSKRSQQDDLVAEIQRRMESLESEAKSTYQQIAEAKTTLKVYDINRERLKISVQNAVEENRHLQESEKQLLQEAVGWNERFSELNEQTKMFESSKADIEESLKNKESQVKSLTECLLKMKDWISAIEEQDDTEDSYWANDTKEKTENGEHLDDQDKRTVRKLIYAAKLNASLKSLETERNQIYSKLTDENKAKEELAERIENLQREHVTLQSENKNFESEVQKLQQKLKVVTELYQENEMNLHRKLTVEEKERLQKEEKLSKVDKKINHATEELATYRQRAKDLEDELERTVRSYQNQIMSHEKKAHDNWLTARATERLLNDIKKENLHCRQELTEAEIKCDILEKDPYALHVPVRAFGRGSRGPGNAGIYEASNEREEMSSDRLSNPHRPPSDSGSLSPPWDRDRRIMMPFPAGKPYNDQPLPPQRQERFYPNPPNSGRLSGPAELRSYNMHSFDKADGHISESNSRMDLSGNGIKDIPNDSNMSNVADHPVASEGETFGPGVVPPPPFPLLRAPLMPMDPRGPFMRRGPPFPPVPPSGVYGPREYFPRDFAGLPRPPLPMRTPFPLRPFSQYPPPRAGFFPPPPPPPPDNSNELPSGSTQLSAAASTDHQEPQQET